jgi:anti-sigma28 factor (negative regulator of flagellin synthesis)
MRIDSSGNLLVGKTSANSATTGVELKSGGLFSATRADSPAGIFNRTTSDGQLVQFRRNNTNVGSVSVTTTATTYNTSSDARLKDITGEARGLAVINELNPVAYDWKADGKSDEGLIAQEVKELVPNAVSETEDGYYQMDYSKLVTPLIKAVQEQQKQIEELKQQLEELKN